MAQTGYEEPKTGSPELPPRESTDRARQGQHIKGMIWVLIVGTVLLSVAYMIMLALQAEPVTPDGKVIENAAPTPGPSGPAPATPETAESPS
jgi:hypothetical protein